MEVALEQLKQEISLLNKRIEDMNKQQISNMQYNKCLLNLLFYKTNFASIFYFKTKSCLYLFKNNAFLFNHEFFSDFILKHYSASMERFDFGVLKESSRLYQEHYNLFKPDTVMFKYVNRTGIISKSVISSDQAQNLYIESEYLGLENYTPETNIRYVDQPKRKILEGKTVEDIMKNMSSEERVSLLTKLFDELFDTYKEGDLLNGILLDSHLDNILYLDGKFIFFDKDVIYAKPIPKILVIYRALYGRKEYEHFVKYYGLEENIEKCQSIYQIMGNNPDMIKARINNQNLIDFYFSEKNFI